MIGSLLYLTIHCPNIYFSVGVCARYQVDSKESHLYAEKRIIKYVNEAFDFGIWYIKDTNSSFIGFNDTGSVENEDNRKAQLMDVFILETI